MCESGFEPNEVTMVAVFSTCAEKGDLRFAERVHEFAETRGVGFSMNMMNSMLDMYVKCGSLEKAGKIFEKMEVKDMFSWTSMINGCGKNGEVELAQKLFDEMPERNVVSWNAMIGGYSQNNRPKEALELFHDMEREGLGPMESTLVLVLSACAQSGCMEIGQRICDRYVKQKRIPFSVILGNAFIDMYAKCGNIDAAGEIFDEMTKKDLVSYNSMILSACAHGGLVKKGWDYFRDRELFGLTPTIEHYTCMIDLLGRVGHLEEGYELKRSMPMELYEAIWGALLNGCRMHGNVELRKFAAEKLIVLDPKDSGAYMLLASLCANKRKWGDVRMAGSMMRDNGVKKTPGSSFIELGGEFHDFIVADESHPKSEAIYRVLGEILLLSKLDDYTTHAYQIDTFL